MGLSSLIDDAVIGSEGAVGFARKNAKYVKGKITGIYRSPAMKEVRNLGTSVANDVLMRGPSHTGGQWFNRGLQYGGGAAAGAGYSYYTDDGHMGRDMGLGVLGVGAFRGGRSLYKGGKEPAKAAWKSAKTGFEDLSNTVRSEYSNFVERAKVRSDYSNFVERAKV